MEANLPSADRVLPAGFVRHLLLGLPFPETEHNAAGQHFTVYRASLPKGDHAVRITASGLRIKCAIVKGKIDLSDCFGAGDWLPPLVLEYCTLEGDGHEDSDDKGVMTSLDVTRARFAHLSLLGSRLSHLRACEALIDGPVELSDIAPLNSWKDQPWPGVEPEEQERWMSAQAKYLHDLHHPEHDFEQPLAPHRPEKNRPRPDEWPESPRDHCWINFRGARIDGEFCINRARLRAPPPRKSGILPTQHRVALKLSHTEIKGSVYVLGGSRLEGGIDVASSQITGDLGMSGAYCTEGERGFALSAQASAIEGSVLLDEGFRAFGSAWLRYVEIGEVLQLRNGCFDGGAIDGKTTRSLSLVGAKIHSNLLMEGCLCRTGVDMEGCRLDGDLEAYNARLDGAETWALRAKGMTIGGTAFFDGDHTKSEEFCTLGGMNLVGLKVIGDLKLVSGVFSGRREDPDAIIADGMSVGRELMLNLNIIHGNLSLIDVKCATLNDHRNGYEGVSDIRLDGLRYDRLAWQHFEGGVRKDRGAWLNGFRTTKGRKPLKRKDWHGEILAVAHEFNPQPYTHLAKVLSSQGCHDDARDIRVLKAEAQRRTVAKDLWRFDGKYGPKSLLFFVGRMLSYIGHWLFGLLFGYGLKPRRAIITMTAALISGWAFFSWLEMRGALIIDQVTIAGAVQRDQMGSPIWTGAPSLDSSVPCGDAIRPPLYALDVFVPLIDLREESKCEVGIATDVNPGISVFGSPVFLKEATQPWELEIYRYLKALYAIAGSLIISLSILTFSGVLQRRDKDE